MLNNYSVLDIQEIQDWIGHEFFSQEIYRLKKPIHKNL